MRFSVTLAGAEVAMVLPASATERIEVLGTAASNRRVPLRRCAAAVGCCWGDPKTRPASGFTGNLDTYGREVADELLSRGASVQEVLAAGDICILQMLDDGVPGLALAKEAAGPTAAPAAESALSTT